ncbi:MAG: T9SS type A sorting domain-containing protein [Bacteroidia bacterium]
MKKIVYTALLLFIAFISNQVYTYTNQPPLSLTGAPGESNCSSCHGPTVTSGTVWSNMSLSTSVALSAMQPSTTYLMSLTFSDPGSIKYGFQIVALPGNATSTTASLGTIALNSGNTAVNVATSGNRTYARTNSSGTTASGNSRTWNFNYTTPSTATNGVTFYVVVNSTDNNNMANSGDLIYLKSFSATVLPVKWLDFNYKLLTDGILLNWSTASEINNSHFEIEYSFDNEIWQYAGKVDGASNSNTINRYNFFHQTLNNQKVYYKIKQVDFDGKSSYSNTIVVYDKNEEIKIWANQELKQITTNIFEPVTVKLIKLNGEVVLYKQNHIGSIHIYDLLPGIYIVELTDKSGSTKTQKIVIQ